MIQIKKAQRSKVKLKIGLSGVSGSGKTMSALLLAKGIAGDLSRVCVIDTENDSASLYADMGDFSTISISPPYSPQRYCEAIVAASKSKQFDVLIIDSVSHEWDGSGGCLEIQESLGGRFQDWAKVTPMHRQFIDCILQVPMHVITTARRKQDYTMEQNEKGKAQPKKVGLKEVQREGFEYELTVNFDVEINHMALASKDRTGIFNSKVPFFINEEIGQKIKEWNEAGADKPVPEPKPTPLPAQPKTLADANAEPPPLDSGDLFPEEKGLKNYAPISMMQRNEMFELAKTNGIAPEVIQNYMKEKFNKEKSMDLLVWEYEDVLNQIKGV
jgi:hypothetical protein